VDGDANLLTVNEAKRVLSRTGCRMSETRFFLLFPERLHRLSRPIEDGLARLPIGGQYAVFGIYS
jgi:hypothetical protein